MSDLGKSAGEISCGPLDLEVVEMVAALQRSLAEKTFSLIFLMFALSIMSDILPVDQETLRSGSGMSTQRHHITPAKVPEFVQLRLVS